MTSTGFGCCLADDMGLGKTIEIIAFLLARLKTGKKGGVSLILCPTSVISNWEHEFKKFAPSLKVQVHHGLSRTRNNAFISDVLKYNIVLTSYALLHRDIEFLSTVKWDGVIADEAQYVKNYSTKQSKAIRSLASNFRIALTGTPIENRLEDLRSIFEFINPGYLGSEKRFRKLFSNPIEKEGDEDATRALNRLVNPIILRRVKTDRKIISDLPEKDETKVFVPLTQEQASLYDATVTAMLESVEEKEGIERKGIILSAITKLKRLLDHPSLVSGDLDRRFNRSQKLVRLMEMLEEILGAKEKTLIFTQYVEAGKIIKETILKRFREEAMFLNGSTSRVMREQMVSRFQSPEGPRIFVISVKAGGFGINLTAATNVIHFDRWWNPSVEDQATDRAYRIGQSKQVHVYKFARLEPLRRRLTR
ncbi:Non-specific serine/threonine protein kinase [mine drainage metagenome]|uniref:Non-specific serine/threonine protein kinase n=1 Tax=mine drainage metagenome TaxID=410659 RepID=T0XVA4_9ZZZZ